MNSWSYIKHPAYSKLSPTVKLLSLFLIAPHAFHACLEHTKIFFRRLKECSFHGLIYLWKLFRRAKSKALKYLGLGKCREVEEHKRMKRENNARQEQK